MKADEIEILYNEINVLRNLDHPNIVKIYEYFEDEKRFYIVTELCSGGELFDFILKEGHVPEKEAAIIMKHVLACVNYCHINKIVHRDLKPENILLEANSENFDDLKIIDFGTSQYFNPQTLSESGDECDIDGPGSHSQHGLSQVIGTPFYIAPEVLKKNYGSKCDIWSCGVIAYMMLSGTPPIGGKN